MNVLQAVAMTTKTILLIYTEPNLLEVLQACLSDWGGWNVLTAGSTLEGLQQAALHQPDAIILELSLSGMGGLRFLEQLTAQPTTQKIPVVLLTARAKWLDSQLFQRYQVAGVIANSFNPAMFSAGVASLLGWELNAQVD